MSVHPKMRLLLLLGSLMTLAVVALPQSAYAAGGNSAAAHACQQGGYFNFVRSDGSIFNNVGECVSYAANGGDLVPVTLTATFVPDPNRGIYEDLTLTGSGLLPGSTVSYSYIPVMSDVRTVVAPTHGNDTVAPDGSFLTGWGTGCPLDHAFEFYATTAYGTPITATGC